ncbi:MAG: hypothetical protein COY81_01745 [Candidatus Pacebacteria bacterium CG_4_10_14_0_8_um_filter_43_12]|nr:MAG: hypothetical protein COU66_01250 [Candidatus Pacebacteria bacterium CG10_big_fil_rev_8_21_14_0_10_44_11]PIY79576.1 MAG: hypothetical protein COY81_01745 [Candidatus Pacebacteria bacterium CG_4_10_14_0_8_um_filter_43_12]
MLNNLRERKDGPLFDQTVFFMMDGLARQLRLVCETFPAAIIRSLDGLVTLEGSLEFRRTYDKGQPAWGLFFLSKDREHQILVTEGTLAPPQSKSLKK